jgi:hypothetical protein
MAMGNSFPEPQIAGVQAIYIGEASLDITRLMLWTNGGANHQLNITSIRFTHS